MSCSSPSGAGSLCTVILLPLSHKNDDRLLLGEWNGHFFLSFKTITSEITLMISAAVPLEAALLLVTTLIIAHIAVMAIQISDLVMTTHPLVKK